jgi:hypothetical protein
MPTLVATDTSRQCVITNNSGKDIIVTLNVPTNEAIDADAIVNASGTLEVLLTTDGKSIIKSGSSGTVTLDHTYKPNGDVSGYVQRYDIVISESNWLYPLSVIPIAQQSDNGNTGYPSQTIGTDSTAMAQAATFYQTLIAYPASGLEKDYTTALQAAQDAAAAKANGSPDSASAAAAAMEHAMDAFFKSSKDYNQVTLADVVAIDNYYSNLPAVWSQYKDSLIYYLYGSDGTTAGFAGSLSLAKSGPVDITKPNGGYACTFAPASNPADKNSTAVDATKAVALTYTDGTFSDDPQSKQPAIALCGTFLPLSSLSGKDGDNEIIMVLSGSVQGTSCVGFDAPQTASAPQQVKLTATSEWDKYWDVLLHPKNQKDLIVSIATLVGAVLLLPAMGAAVYGLYRAIRYKAAMREALTKQIVEYTGDALKKMQTDSLLDKGDALRIGADLGAFYVEFNPNNIEGFDRVVNNDTVANNLIKALELQREGLRKALEFSSAMTTDQVTSINQSLGKIKDSIQTLTTSPRTQLETELPRQFATYKEVTKTVMDIYYNAQKALSEEAKTLIIQNSDKSQQVSQGAEDSFNNEGKEENEVPEPADHFAPFE